MVGNSHARSAVKPLGNLRLFLLRGLLTMIRRPSRISRHQLLEKRQLLAGDVCSIATAPQDTFVAQITVPSDDAGPLSRAGSGEGEALDLAGATTAFEFSLAQHLATHPVDGLLVEDAGNVAAVRTALGSTDGGFAGTSKVYLFGRSEQGELIERAVIATDFLPSELRLTDHSLIIIGQSGDPIPIPDGTVRSKLHWLSVSLEQPSQRYEGSLNGVLNEVALVEDRLYVTAIESPIIIPAIAPPPPIAQPATLTVFDVSTVAPSRIASGEILGSVDESNVVGQDLLLLESGYPPDVAQESTGRTIVGFPNDPIHHLVRYRIDGQTLAKVGELELNGGYHLETRIADNGQSAVVVARQSYFSGALGFSSPSIQVHLIDLSTDTPSLFQTVPVTTRSPHFDFEIGRRAVVIADGTSQVILVNTNPFIDIDPASRLTSIQVQSTATAFPGFANSVREMTADLFLIARPLLTSTGDATQPAQAEQMQLSVLSLDQNALLSAVETTSRVIAVFPSPGAAPLTIPYSSPFLEPLDDHLQVVSVNGDGQLLLGNQVDLSGVLEYDANADRLLVRFADRLLEYRWDNLAQPIEIPLGAALPPVIAVDDVFERNADGRDIYLDVLQNDQFSQATAVSEITITELIDAPTGLSIAPSGAYIRMSEELLRSGESFQFGYLIRRGNQQSRANVEVNLFRFDDQDVRAAIERIVSQAAENLEIAPAEIVVGNQLRFTARPMPETISPDVANPLAGAYGVIVDLQVGDQLYRYAADFSGNVAQLSARTLETLMAIEMTAVDASGSPTTSLSSGDEFFIEVTAKDLRAFGAGVFAIAFDLPIPASHLELTGEVQLLGDWDDYGEPIKAGGIDEFRAVESLVDHPGNAIQPVARFGVRALAGGNITLRMNPADDFGSELLLRGRDTVVSPLEVRFGTLELTIDGIRPTDTDANGAVTPIDALRVINFLARFGAMELDALPTLFGTEGEQQATDARLAAMRRLDTNADQTITARDALMVINEVARFRSPLQNGEALEGELVDTALLDESGSLF